MSEKPSPTEVVGNSYKWKRNTTMDAAAPVLVSSGNNQSFAASAFGAPAMSGNGTSTTAASTLPPRSINHATITNIGNTGSPMLAAWSTATALAQASSTSTTPTTVTATATAPTKTHLPITLPIPTSNTAAARNATNSGLPLIAPQPLSQPAPLVQPTMIPFHAPSSGMLTNAAPIHPAPSLRIAVSAPPTTTATASILGSHAIAGTPSAIYSSHLPMVQAVPIIPHGCPQQSGSVFQNIKLRRGKWTAEEESYAELLISEFERGAVEDCENGCTLRAFLAKKLHCAPMRISKKYAGQSIGKHVFLARSNAGAGQPRVDNSAKLQKLEIAFYKSLFREQQLGSSTMPQFLLPTMPDKMRKTVREETSYAIAPAIPVANTQQQPWVNAALHSTGPTPAPSTGNPTLVPIATQQTRQLQQTFFNVLQQQAKASMNANAVPGPTENGEHQATISSVIPANLQPNAQQQTPAVQLGPANTATRPTNFIPVEPNRSAMSSAPGASGGVATDIPDFLSGFEKVAASRTAPTGAPMASSPPFTSRSFDDFHRFLGKGLSPSEGNSSRTNVIDVSGKTSRKIPSLGSVMMAPPAAGYLPYVPGQPFPAIHLAPSDKPVTTADSYAMFAQESANAVMQHSAYSRGNSSEGFIQVLSTDQLQQDVFDEPIPQLLLQGLENGPSPEIVSSENQQSSLQVAPIAPKPATTGLSAGSKPPAVMSTSMFHQPVMNAANLQAHNARDQHLKRDIGNISTLATTSSLLGNAAGTTNQQYVSVVSEQSSEGGTGDSEGDSHSEGSSRKSYHKRIKTTHHRDGSGSRSKLKDQLQKKKQIN